MNRALVGAHTRPILFLWALIWALAGPVQAAWLSYGIGGGGALFSPSLSPHDTDEIFMKTDMSTVFRSTNFGTTWDALDFRRLSGSHLTQVS